MKVNLNNQSRAEGSMAVGPCHPTLHVLYTLMNTHTGHDSTQGSIWHTGTNSMICTLTGESDQVTS